MDLKELESLSSELGVLLKEKNYFFTTAESCTGGWVGQSLTSVPGSSSWYGCGFITYSNIAKHKVLDVSKETLNSYGAVSEEVAKDMAFNVRKLLSTDYGLSATIWTEDKERATRVSNQVEAGVIWVNCWLVRDLRTPFGGMKQSGMGREGGSEALKFFTEQKNVCTSIE